ncbi:MAG: response regulator, partial [Bacteroidota bacterium]
EIGVNSKDGVGSVFWFKLPFSLLVRQQDDLKEDGGNKTKGDTFNRKRVLVAEDNPINQRIIDFQLKKLGFNVEIVMNGLEAVNSFCKNPFDLIILDIQMPVMDGYQAAKRIRELENSLTRHTPIIALTANAMKGDRELYLSAGMDDYISKPFTYEVLQRTIENLIQENK